MKHEKFLEFNGRSLSLLARDGQYWVAIKPICEALNVNFDRQYQNLKAHKLFSQLYAKQHMVGADLKPRKMVALPERYIYGWIFQIRSASADLQSYQKECCDILYNHFHGTITGRTELLRRKAELLADKNALISELSDHPQFTRYLDKEAQLRRITPQLRKLDQELVASQQVLWQSNKQHS